MKIELDLVLDGDVKGKVSINSIYVETIVDGLPLHKKPVTQICMTSGARFFVNHTYEEVKSLISLS